MASPPRTTRAASLLLLLFLGTEPGWLFGGRWVELDRACETRLPDGRTIPAGMAFEEGRAVFHPPAGMGGEAPVALSARYGTRGESALVVTTAPNGAAGEILLHPDGPDRLRPDRLRDEAGYVYRRCADFIG